MGWSDRAPHADSDCVSEGSTAASGEASAHAQFAESLVQQLALAQEQLDALKNN
jgi:hypothetical protein